MKEVNVSLKEMKQMEKEERKTKVTNIYKGISTEERIRIYLKICGFIYEQAEER
ncbi:MAG: hypothetical protein J1E98_04590 [Lachnospiraceae bacterium]|nr:hypothetical protein [Lachnospiraceae bacterium]